VICYSSVGEEQLAAVPSYNFPLAAVQPVPSFPFFPLAAIPSFPSTHQESASGNN
jgi:hypothetical protein